MIWEDCNNSLRDPSSKYVCRISWRKGEPLGLSVVRRMTFYDLSREVRDEIYRLSLIALGHIMVWNGWSSDSSATLENRITSADTFSVDRMVPELPDLAFNLLRCSCMISREAGAVFYRFNTFLFSNVADWSPLYLFLRMLGAENRSQLTSLSIQTDTKQWAQCGDNGVNVSSDIPDCVGFPNPWPFGRVVSAVAPDPRSCSSFALLEGINELAIQACFLLFAEEERALTLHVGSPMWHAIPGVTHGNDTPFPRSMQVPKFLERLRQSLHGRRVEVVWTVMKQASILPLDRGALQQVGWEVRNIRHCAPNWRGDLIEMILRRRPLDEMRP